MRRSIASRPKVLPSSPPRTCGLGFDLATAAQLAVGDDAEPAGACAAREPSQSSALTIPARPQAAVRMPPRPPIAFLLKFGLGLPFRARKGLLLIAYGCNGADYSKGCRVRSDGVGAER